MRCSCIDRNRQEGISGVRPRSANDQRLLKRHKRFISRDRSQRNRLSTSRPRPHPDPLRPQCLVSEPVSTLESGNPTAAGFRKKKKKTGHVRLTTNPPLHHDLNPTHQIPGRGPGPVSDPVPGPKPRTQIHTTPSHHHHLPSSNPHSTPIRTQHLTQNIHLLPPPPSTTKHPDPIHPRPPRQKPTKPAPARLRTNRHTSPDQPRQNIRRPTLPEANKQCRSSRSRSRKGCRLKTAPSRMGVRWQFELGGVCVVSARGVRGFHAE